jgi:hypothetical protein
VTPDEQERHSGAQAQCPGNPERQPVLATLGPDCACAERRKGGAELMAGTNPSIHAPGVFAPKASVVKRTVGGTVAIQSSP